MNEQRKWVLDEAKDTGGGRSSESLYAVLRVREFTQVQKESSEELLRGKWYYLVYILNPLYGERKVRLFPLQQ